MKILLFAASLRNGSLNKKLAGYLNEILKVMPNTEIDFADFNEFEMPIYNGDVEESSGVPSGGKELAKRIQQVDAMIIAVPEYNGSIPGSLKNAIDWISRVKPNPIAGKHLLLVGASPGALGAVRGLWHSRVPFEALGVHVYPEMFGLSQAHDSFDETGALKDPKKRDQLAKLILNFVANIN